MDENPFDFSAPRAPEPKKPWEKWDKTEKPVRKPPPSGFFSNRKYSIICALLCVVPALALGFIPMIGFLGGPMLWPAFVIRALGNIPNFLLVIVLGFGCFLGIVINLLKIFRTDGITESGQYDSDGNPIMKRLPYHCPNCRLRWNWYQLPTFYETYKCPRCEQTSLFVMTTDFWVLGSPTLAIGGYLGLVYVLLVTK